jgi:acetyl esterase
MLRWMAQTRPQEMDGERIAVGAESAGDNLAAALCIWARDNEGPSILHQAIIYPFTVTTLNSAD